MLLVRLLFACIVAFAIPVQGFAAAAMAFCGAAHQEHGSGQARSLEPLAHEHALNEQENQSGGSHTAGHHPDSSHDCGVCASCCQAAAITPAMLPALPDGSAHTDPGEPSLPPYGRSALLPDKPPRA